MRLPRLYAVTDENVVPNDRLIEACDVILGAGVRLLQIRFKTTPYALQLELGLKLRELTRAHHAILVINDNPDLAKEIKADGVHLGADDPDVATARDVLGADAIIGVSSYDEVERVTRWEPGEITYLGMATPYPSPTKPKVNPDLDTFRDLVSHARVPVYAIGGVTPKRVPELLQAGCYGVAVVSAVFAAEDPARAVVELTHLLQKKR